MDMYLQVSSGILMSFKPSEYTQNISQIIEIYEFFIT